MGVLDCDGLEYCAVFLQMSREKPRSKVMGINKNAMRMGKTMSSALSAPVKKDIRAAPGNNISHPIKQRTNDHGQSD
jgi:hypothetical protein